MGDKHEKERLERERIRKETERIDEEFLSLPAEARADFIPPLEQSNIGANEREKQIWEKKKEFVKQKKEELRLRRIFKQNLAAFNFNQRSTGIKTSHKDRGVKPEKPGVPHQRYNNKYSLGSQRSQDLLRGNRRHIDAIARLLNPPRGWDPRVSQTRKR